MPRAYIKATSAYLPKKILSNSDLEKLVDTSDEWIVTRTGMKERRVAEEDEFTSDMGVLVGESVLKKTGISPREVDLVLVATLSPDYPFPSTACLIQERLSLTHAFAFDIQAACSGWIYALAIAKGFIESGMYKNILVIASEKLSSLIDYTDRETCVLFGDGAASALISSEGPGLELGDANLGSDGSGAPFLIMPGGGCRHKTTHETVEQKLHYLRMDGKEVYRAAVRNMEKSVMDCLKRAHLSADEIDYVLPHQANMRIMESLSKRCGIPMERILQTVQKYGNTSASSIGIALDELLETTPLKEGARLLLVAFGAGFTWGSMVLTWREELSL